MPRFAAGVVKFQNEVYPQKKDLFERLSQGQAPEAMFIACSDSRVETAMITQTDPGDLFICRTAGNIVPPHSQHTGGVTATVEFAVSVLKVPHIVVCGHTECGAMKGAMHPEQVGELPHVRKWLSYTRAAVAVVDELCAGQSEDQRMKMLLEQNVVLQMQHLRTHPSVAAALARQALQIHGWVYDIKTGGVTAYDDASNSFLPVQEHYAELAAKYAGH
ncbi:MAG: carbonic anhydrase [Aquisalinus sp.]|nr:carbonic anhydrase [Aquisalinus sp.]